MKKNIILGIDIGGSKIRAILLDGKKVLSAHETKTPKNLIAFRKALRNLVGSNSTVGIAVPGRIRGAVFVSATNLAYIRNFNFKNFFGKTDVHVDHDARCFARAEYKNKEITFFLTLGTGIGRAVGMGGKILNIKKFERPERWEKEYQKIRDSKKNRALAIFLAKHLKRCFKEYNPKLIIVGGGVAGRRIFLAKFRKAAGLPVRKSKFGKNAVAMGAALSAA